MRRFIAPLRTCPQPLRNTHPQNHPCWIKVWVPLGWFYQMNRPGLSGAPFSRTLAPPLSPPLPPHQEPNHLEQLDACFRVLQVVFGLWWGGGGGGGGRGRGREGGGTTHTFLKFGRGWFSAPRLSFAMSTVRAQSGVLEGFDPKSAVKGLLDCIGRSTRLRGLC